MIDEKEKDNTYRKEENSKIEENKTDHVNINNKFKNNDEDESFNFLINSYINKSNYSILKSMNNNNKSDNNPLNDDLSESDIVYKLKKDNKYKAERQKENSIIINNNIQINNLIDDKSKNLYFVHNDGIRENFEKINNNKYRNSYNITESKAISYNFNRVNNAF